MEVYGLTGGIGSGKSAVAALLEEYGVPVVSADELSRIVVARGSEGLADVERLFGPEVLDEKGDLDRRKMAAIVFADPAKRRQLEGILHPRIRERFEQVLDALEKAGHQVAVYEVPLLFEKNLQGEMKAVILVSADEAVRIARVRARDDVTQTEVEARMAAQMPEEEKRRKADYIIDNNGTLDDVRREVEFLLSRFLRVGTIRRRDPAAKGGTQEVPVVADEEAVSQVQTRTKTLIASHEPKLVESPPSQQETQPGVRVERPPRGKPAHRQGPSTVVPATPGSNEESDLAARRTLIVTHPGDPHAPRPPSSPSPSKDDGGADR